MKVQQRLPGLVHREEVISRRLSDEEMEEVAHEAGLLEDPVQAARIRAEMLEFLDERSAGDPSGVQLVNCSFDASLAGRTLRDILDERGVAPTPENMAEPIPTSTRRGWSTSWWAGYRSWRRAR